MEGIRPPWTIDTLEMKKRNIISNYVKTWTELKAAHWILTVTTAESTQINESCWRKNNPLFKSETDLLHSAESVWCLISAADLLSAEFLSTGETLPPTDDTETPRNQTRPWTQHTEVQWMWCWRCGGGSVCQRRLCRRTESQQDSPHTLLLC